MTGSALPPPRCCQPSRNPGRVYLGAQIEQKSRFPRPCEDLSTHEADCHGGETLALFLQHEIRVPMHKHLSNLITIQMLCFRFHHNFPFATPPAALKNPIKNVSKHLSQSTIVGCDFWLQFHIHNNGILVKAQPSLELYSKNIIQSLNRSQRAWDFSWLNRHFDIFTAFYMISAYLLLWKDFL